VIKRLNHSVQSYEKQCARDKMIVKFREDRIAKLELTEPKDDKNEKQIRQLKQEISLLKESLEQNAKAAKITAEKEQIQAKLKQLQDEAKETPESLTRQMR